MCRVEGGGIGCGAGPVVGNCGVGSWGVQGWGAQSRGGRGGRPGHAEQGRAGWGVQSRGHMARAHRAGAHRVGHMRLGSHRPCVGHGGDLLSVMGLARGRPWGVAVSHGLVTWWAHQHGVLW